MKDILMLYYEINNIYLELYKLELSGKRGSVSFRELVKLLKDKIREEKLLFDNIDEYFDEEKIDNNKLDTPYAKRIADYMSFNQDVNTSIYEDDLEEDILDKIQISNYAKIYKSCSENLFLIYLSYLQELLEIDKYSSFRDKLLNYKYLNSFMYHDVENMLVRNDFNVDRVNYVNINIMADLFRSKLANVDSIILDCYYDTVMTTIEQLLLIKDNEYNIDDRVVVSLNNQCMLRAALGLIDDNDYVVIVSEIYNHINRFIKGDNMISANIINSILDERNKDKERIRRISMVY